MYLENKDFINSCAVGDIIMVEISKYYSGNCISFLRVTKKTAKTLYFQYVSSERDVKFTERGGFKRDTGIVKYATSNYFIKSIIDYSELALTRKGDNLYYHYASSFLKSLKDVDLDSFVSFLTPNEISNYKGYYPVKTASGSYIMKNNENDIIFNIQNVTDVLKSLVSTDLVSI